MQRYLCVHGHFYQPPRENPWLEAIEVQDGAAPYHDWNERIDAECYAQNGRSRILDREQRIERLVNNYARISFNFGPTLLSWMEQHSPESYEAVLEADRQSRERFSGHGSAIAQAYNHAILPLCSERDRRTQVRWGLRDFERRFGRRPEGMWLPETAVDVPTLEVLAEEGLAFTILAPSQAARVRKLEGRRWKDISGERIDPSRAYLQRLPSGRSIALFFYDGPVSQAIAFEHLLESSERFVARLRGGFSATRDWPQLMHVATDGESYGHHHRFGDMALAAALQAIENDPDVALTNYGEFLERHPPTHEVEVHERTAWSCAHGLGRWSRDCGCSAGRAPGWSQAWREPLRAALDWLRDELAPLFERAGGELLRDPWHARDEYVDVLHDRSPERVDAFLGRHAARPIEGEERVRCLRLLEMQRHALLMYTSCGWFFDELSGLETTQVIAYAARALQLGELVLGAPLEPAFLERLARAPSNVKELGDGRAVYERSVKPSMLDLERVGAHYAVSSLFDAYGEDALVYCYETSGRHRAQLATGRLRLGYGQVAVRSRVDGARATMTYAAVHFGDHNVSGGILPGAALERDPKLFERLVETFQRADVPGLVRRLTELFPGESVSLRMLFRDEQRRILRALLSEHVAAADAAYRAIYQDTAGLMHFLCDQGVPPPRPLAVAAERALRQQIDEAVRPEGALDVERVRATLREAAARRVLLDGPLLEFRFRRCLEELARRFARRPSDLQRLRDLESGVRLLGDLPFDVDVWSLQNRTWTVLQDLPRERLRAARAGDLAASEWLDRLRSLGELLHVVVSLPHADPDTAPTDVAGLAPAES